MKARVNPGSCEDHTVLLPCRQRLTLMKNEMTIEISRKHIILRMII